MTAPVTLLAAQGAVSVSVGDADPIEVATFDFPISMATSGLSESDRVATIPVGLAGQLSEALRGLAEELTKDTPKTVLRGDAAVLNQRGEEVTAQIADAKRRRREMEHAEYREGPAHVIHGDRQTGKTYLAIQWLLAAPADVDRHLLVHHADIARALRRQHGTENVHTFRTFEFETARLHARRRGARIEIGVDDAQLILSQMLGVPQLDLVTITTDEPRG